MMATVLAGADVAHAATLAAVLEVSAAKPGNVTPAHDFGDMRFEDLVASALAIGPAIGDAGTAGVGATVHRAIEDTRRHVATNTNLGIVLLFAPLACAAATGSGSLRERLHEVLAALTVADAEDVYAAIRLARPAGLGEAREQDVREAPTVTLRQAMALAAERDAIAREYVTDYDITFDIAGPALQGALAAGATLRPAATEAFLTVLAEVPDTHIARKCGGEVARRVSRGAARVLAAGERGSVERRSELEHFDRSLRDPRNLLNPGTTADLTAAALFVRLLEQDLSEQE